MKARRPTVLMRLSSIIACASLCASCIVVPVNYTEYGNRKNLSKETIDKIVVGVTTKEDVLLDLGEPDFISMDETCLEYSWSKAKLLWLAAAGYNAIGGTVARDYKLTIMFDERNVVVDKHFTARSSSH
jgi:hypothetical protein